jgi:hypothetical protein
VLDGPSVVWHAYNSNYAGGRDQEDHGLRPAQGKYKQNFISANKVGML